MANTERITAPATTDEDFSLWALKFKFPSIQSDPWRWNKEWEKVLRTLSFSKDVYPMMGGMYKKDSWPTTELSTHTQGLKGNVCEMQNVVANLWGELQEKGHIVTAWFLLPESERQRHLLKGLEGACQRAHCRQDARALCPEITISSMSKQRGQAFIDFIDAYKKGKDDVSENTPYYLPSEWWGNALEDLPQTLTDTFVESTFALLTLHRNEFISHFLIHAAMSVLHDLSKGSAGMDPVTDFMKAQGPFATAWGKTLAGVRDKPVVRCEHCTKTPEEIGRDVKFMLCSVCKSKLDFPVHYCSQACQKGDWQRHKKHCGKNKVSKKLPGTVHDPFWAFPEMPDHLRHVPDVQGGGVPVASVGFPTPNSQREYSQALQRQLSLINADKEVDYFLFDDDDRPVRVVLHGMWIKMAFRIFRSDILSTSEQNGLGAIAEYLIKVMGQKPGLSRETILRQLQNEYGGDVASKVAEWERKAAENGFEGSTFLENMSRNLMASVPLMMGTGPN